MDHVSWFRGVYNPEVLHTNARRLISGLLEYLVSSG
jgi:hypothetical protein